MMKRLSVGQRLYMGVMAVFLLFAGVFIVFQQVRERQYKTDVFHTRLQGINAGVAYLLCSTRQDSVLRSFIARQHIPGLRITLVDRTGRVVFDNVARHARTLANHAGRPEVQQALRTGSGFTVERNSTTLGQEYFYSATYDTAHQLVIRSAVPYSSDLAETLSADSHFLWFALLAVLILTGVFYRFTHRLGKNVSNLRKFAERIARNEPVDTEDLVIFPGDELGDIAERIIKLYKRLQSTQREQDVLKRQLTQNVAHELKTPVASIQGYLETLLNNPDAPNDKKLFFIERAYAQSQRLGLLLRDISTLNRMDDAPDMMQPAEWVDIGELVQTVMSDTGLQMQERGMQFHSDIPEHLTIYGNRSLLYSIFRNLTDNAIAYAGMQTTISIHAHAAQKDTWQFVFSDNGVGVPHEHLGRLFERFYRVDKGRSRKMGGTGLGLAIVKNAVLLHGGCIVVEAPQEGGLRFVFTLRSESTKAVSSVGSMPKE